jgi:hypothetical protein
MGLLLLIVLVILLLGTVPAYPYSPGDGAIARPVESDCFS